MQGSFVRVKLVEVTPGVLRHRGRHLAGPPRPPIRVALETEKAPESECDVFSEVPLHVR